jgi:ribosome biogenesis GTPase
MTSADGVPPGLVIAAHGRRGRLEDAVGHVRPFVLRGRRLRVVCGDRVTWQPGQEREAVVTAIETRANELRRLDVARNNTEVLAANLTLLAAVCAPEPLPDWYVLDRYLCAAAHMGATPIIVWNKCELDNEDNAELDHYRDAGYTVLRVSAHTGAGMAALVDVFAGETGILVGQSGVGKSSLINRLVPTPKAVTRRPHR